MSLPINRKPYLILTFAKIHSHRYISYQEIIELSPERFKGHAESLKKRKDTLISLYKNNLIEPHPEDQEKFRITPLGIKYIYCKKLLRKVHPRRVEEDL